MFGAATVSLSYALLFEVFGSAPFELSSLIAALFATTAPGAAVLFTLTLKVSAPWAPTATAPMFQATVLLVAL